MSQPLLTIGAFARAVGLAPSALRFYDECGLLRPAEVDETTGYRYYTPDLARRAQIVAQMRDAGVPIDVMRTALNGTAEDRRRVLRAVLEEQEQMAARRTTALENLIAEGSDERAGATVSVDGPELAGAIRQVRVAADTDRTSQLSGVLLDFAAGVVDVVATNRFWMAIRTVTTSPADEIRVVLSLPDADRLCGVLERHDGVTLDLGSDGIEASGRRLPVRDVAYPAHRMLLAGLPPPTSRVLLARAEIVAAIEAVRHAEFDMQVAADAVRIGEREIPAAIDNPGTRLRLRSALARRALESALGPKIVLRFGAQTHPVQVASPYQPGFVALLMPVACSEQ